VRAIKIRDLLKAVNHPMTRQQITDKLDRMTNGNGGTNQLFADLVSAGFLVSRMKINSHNGYGLPEWVDKNEKSQNKDFGQ
jgi:hypothetical protein